MKDNVIGYATQKIYCPADAVRIVNYKQAAAYLVHGAELLDVYPSRDFTTDEPLIVYIFNRKETAELYDLWCKHELK